MRQNRSKMMSKLGYPAGRFAGVAQVAPGADGTSTAAVAGLLTDRVGLVVVVWNTGLGNVAFGCG